MALDESEIMNRIAEIMAMYGDQPKVFMFELKRLVIVWYAKGVSYGIDSQKKLEDITAIT